jgi:hypothetical protein
MHLGASAKAGKTNSGRKDWLLRALGGRSQPLHRRPNADIRPNMAVAGAGRGREKYPLCDARRTPADDPHRARCPAHNRRCCRVAAILIPGIGLIAGTATVVLPTKPYLKSEDGVERLPGTRSTCASMAHILKDIALLDILQAPDTIAHARHHRDLAQPAYLSAALRSRRHKI